jgi:hypothetical protein
MKRKMLSFLGVDTIVSFSQQFPQFLHTTSQGWQKLPCILFLTGCRCDAVMEWNRVMISLGLSLRNAREIDSRSALLSEALTDDLTGELFSIRIVQSQN